jgi:orotidine-5'-phosphate decarboxylase
MRLAGLTQSSGLDGVVCSPKEAAALRASLGDDFLLVTPGVRPKDAAADDQRRVMTPADAVGAGASYLVIGRPITAAPEPIEALNRINQELVSA